MYERPVGIRQGMQDNASTVVGRVVELGSGYPIADNRIAINSDLH
jgi:hypothetical protein